MSCLMLDTEETSVFVSLCFSSDKKRFVILSTVNYTVLLKPWPNLNEKELQAHVLFTNFIPLWR